MGYVGSFASAGAIGDLSDVTITSAANGDILVYSGGWVNQSLDSAGIVAKAGAQTITGAKTFSSIIVSMDGTIKISDDTTPTNVVTVQWDPSNDFAASRTVNLPGPPGTEGTVLSTDGGTSTDTWSWDLPEEDQWRLVYTSATVITLQMLGDSGSGANVGTIHIEGGRYVFTSAVTGAIDGATIVDGSTTVSANTVYYVYALLSGGSVVLQLSTTAPASHDQGIKAYKTGDPSLRLVGKLRTNGSSQIDTDAVWSARNSLTITDNPVNDCRLSLSSTLPVTTADVSAATSVYLHGYVGDRIALFNTTSGQWEIYQIASPVSLDISGLTADTNYDIYAFGLMTGGTGIGTVGLQAVVWSTDTARGGIAPARDPAENEVLVEAADGRKRWLGTLRINSTGGQCEDTVLQRFLWNQYHRVPKPLLVTDGGGDWTYTSNTVRQANANTANQAEVVIGNDEVGIVAEVIGSSLDADADDRYMAIGIDSTSAVHASCLYDIAHAGATARCTHHAKLRVAPGIGYHKIVWLESGGSTGGNATTFYDTGAGLSGEIWC